MSSRPSTAIGYKGAQTLYYAREQATRIGRDLNAFVTINFALTSIAPDEAVAAFSRLRCHHFNKWLRRPGKMRGRSCEPTYLYWFENERDGVAFDEIGPALPHNVHVHWYTHVPPARQHAFEGLVFEWLDFISGEISAAGAIDVTYVRQDNGIRAYSLKGAQQHVAKHFGALHSPQGLIVGKRTGTSVNIGPSARIATDRALGIRRRRAA